MIAVVFAAILVVAGIGVSRMMDEGATSGGGPGGPDAGSGTEAGSGAVAGESVEDTAQRMAPISLWPADRVRRYDFRDTPLNLIHQVRLVEIHATGGPVRSATVASAAEDGWRQHRLGPGGEVPGTPYRVERIDERLVLLSSPLPDSDTEAMQNRSGDRPYQLHRLVHPRDAERVAAEYGFGPVASMGTDQLIRLAESSMWAIPAGTRYLSGHVLQHVSGRQLTAEEMGAVLAIIETRVKDGRLTLSDPDAASAIRQALSTGGITSVMLVDPRARASSSVD